MYTYKVKDTSRYSTPPLSKSNSHTCRVLISPLSINQPFCVFRPLWSSRCCHCTAVWYDRSHWRQFPLRHWQQCCLLQQDLGGCQTCTPNGKGQIPWRKCHCGKGKLIEIQNELLQFIEYFLDIDFSGDIWPDYYRNINNEENASPHNVLNIRRVTKFSCSSTSLFYLCAYKNRNYRCLCWLEIDLEW